MRILPKPDPATRRNPSARRRPDFEIFSVVRYKSRFGKDSEWLVQQSGTRKTALPQVSYEKVRQLTSPNSHSTWLPVLGHETSVNGNLSIRCYWSTL